MNDRFERDERVIASLLSGHDSAALPPFEDVRRRAARRTGPVIAWTFRLAVAGVVAVVAVVLGSGLAGFRSGLSEGQAGSQPASAGATSRCLDERASVARWGSVQGVAGAYIVPASDVAAWQETRDAGRGARPQSPFRSYGTEPLLVCFFDGDFDSFPGAAHRPPYDRIVIIFDATGAPILDSAGPRDYLKVERPGPRP